jgi:hypothetical protein
MKVDKTPAKLAKCGPPWAATARHSKKVPSVSAGRSAAGEVAWLKRLWTALNFYWVFTH